MQNFSCSGYMAVKWHSAVTTVTIGNDACLHSFAGHVMQFTYIVNDGSSVLQAI